MITVAILVSNGQPEPPITYLKVDVVAPTTGSNIPAAALNVPPVPVNLVHTPPTCSPVIKLTKEMVAVLLSHTLVLPSVPALGDEVIVSDTILVSLEQGLVPVITYWNVLLVVPAITTNVPAPALNVPPVPVNLVHTPPTCSPVIKFAKVIVLPLPLHSVVAPSVPAFACGVIVTVTTLVSFAHGAVPVITYLNVDVVAPAVGINVPATALNVPPVPVTLVQTPPACSPVIRFAKEIVDVLLSHTLVLPSVPAFACGVMVIVTTLVSLPHGAVPVITYLNVDVVAPDAGT
jgi:hypothetical protein